MGAFIMYVLGVLIFISLFVSFALAKGEVNKPNPLLLQTYGTNDLSTKPVFQGGYINFVLQ